MLKLVTGSPGDGKTSNELWNFLNAKEFSNRPKYCTPINGFVAKDHGVTEIEHIKIWQDLPEGSVIFCDEVQDFCGVDLGAQPPEWVKQLARHRHRGFDFVFTTQSPMFLHPFARKLVKPHVHYIRPWNMTMVRYTWDAVQNDPISKSSKANGLRAKISTNPEVFKLYTSTVLDTHKAKPPVKLILTVVAALALLVAGAFFAVNRLHKVGHVGQEPPAEVASAPGSQPLRAQPGLPTPGSVGADISQHAVWDATGVKPRIPGAPYSAPIYDALTAPTDFPRVAACISSEDKHYCHCYTQQGTPLEVPQGACEVYVRHGSFDPWLSGRRQQQLAALQSAQSQPAPVPADPAANKDDSLPTPVDAAPQDPHQFDSVGSAHGRVLSHKSDAVSVPVASTR